MKQCHVQTCKRGVDVLTSLLTTFSKNFHYFMVLSLNLLEETEISPQRNRGPELPSQRKKCQWAQEQ